MIRLEAVTDGEDLQTSPYSLNEDGNLEICHTEIDPCGFTLWISCVLKTAEQWSAEKELCLVLSN